MDTCKQSIYVGFIVCIMIILFIKNFDFLDRIILENPRITLWSITHFMCYFIVGTLCPNKYLEFLLLGISWEIFEKIYGKSTGDELYWTSTGVSGQLNDIIMNTLGYHLAHIFPTIVSSFFALTFFLVGIVLAFSGLGMGRNR